MIDGTTQGEHQLVLTLFILQCFINFANGKSENTSTR